jgi:hypothetical protein
MPIIEQPNISTAIKRHTYTVTELSRDHLIYAKQLDKQKMSSAYNNKTIK